MKSEFKSRKKRFVYKSKNLLEKERIFTMEHKSIEEQKQAARNTNELLDHLMRVIEQNDERFSFEWLVGGERATMEIFDKEKKIGYAVKIAPIEYDENVELAIKALRNQSVLDELLGQGLKIISSNGDISDFDKYFEK